MNSETVDLIYLDPPFKKNKKFQQPMNGKIQTELMDYMENHVKYDDRDFYDEWHRYIYGYIDEQGTAHSPHLVKGKIVSEFEDAFSFNRSKRDQLEELQTENSHIYDIISVLPQDDVKGYLVFMAIRLIEMKRILKDSGSLYLHCDVTASHYLKILCDYIFGEKNFIGEIVWDKQNGSKSKTIWGNEHDSIFCYAKKKGKHTFKSNARTNRIPFSEMSLQMHFKHKDEKGRRYRIRTINGKEYFYYADEGRFRGNIWDDIPSMQCNSPVMKETIGYPTQKPLNLLNRVIQTSSNENDIVFDPFAGCATALEAAFKNNRQWVGADISFMSAVLLRFRIWRIGDLENDQFCPYRASSKIPPARDDIVREEEYYSTQEIAKRVPVRKWYGEKLYVEQHGKCKKCGEHEKFKAMDVDHIQPLSKGGNNDLNNLQLLCRQCNARKGNKIDKLL